MSLKLFGSFEYAARRRGSSGCLTLSAMWRRRKQVLLIWKPFPTDCKKVDAFWRTSMCACLYKYPYLGNWRQCYGALVASTALCWRDIYTCTTMAINLKEQKRLVLTNGVGSSLPTGTTTSVLRWHSGLYWGRAQKVGRCWRLKRWRLTSRIASCCLLRYYHIWVFIPFCNQIHISRSSVTLLHFHHIVVNNNLLICSKGQDS